MLATTQPEDIPQTIRSRCQHFSFRAVKFEQIVEQLRDLCGRENIQADEDALAFLAEAGDGSMRDALSILDQAIASSQGKLSAEAVRQLIGVAPSGILEEIMQAVARSSSEAILQTVDRLLADGQNPVHFARQLVRFLRNATVAKVAGADSSLLQISSDERARVARVAELFSEEDLTRHLQIMLRTHSELGYRQEQRFHLELGLLKLAHAQRLLPLEQLLSGVEVNRAATPERKLTLAPEPRKPEPPNSPRPFVSPFAADSARKGTPRSEFSGESNPTSARPAPAAASSTPVMMGSAAPAMAAQPAPEKAPQEQASGFEQVRVAVMNALAKADQSILCSMLEAGEWKVEGNQLAISIAASATLIDMSVSADAKRLIIASASGAMGRPMKLQIVPSANPVLMSQKSTASYANGSSRARAEEEPVVRRMKEKFGAEIRTVIDYRKNK
jgi:DNA polymerase-3 subunit gamma/tau